MRLFLLAIAFLIVLVGALVAFFPLDMALRASGIAGRQLSYDAAQGTIWNGRLSNARAGALHLGTVDFTLSAMDLVTGKARVNWSANGQSLQGSGQVTRTLDGTTTLSGTKMLADLQHLPTWTPMAGAFDVDLAYLTFDDQGCVEVDGAMRSRIVVMHGEDQWQAPDMAGKPTCDSRNLVLPLVGQDARSGVDLRMILAPNMQYQASLLVGTQDQKIIDTMESIGFEQKANGYEYLQQGHLGAAGLGQ